MRKLGLGCVSRLYSLCCVCVLLCVRIKCLCVCASEVSVYVCAIEVFVFVILFKVHNLRQKYVCNKVFFNKWTISVQRFKDRQ